jgi:phosphoribosylanthranilate isomerase
MGFIPFGKRRDHRKPPGFPPQGTPVPYHLRVKICGVTTPADAVAAAELGADAVGLNFYPGSPRHIDAPTAEGILAALPPLLEAVAVFADEPWRRALRRANRFHRLLFVQMHGDEHLPDAISYRRIDAFRVRNRTGLRQITRYLDLAAVHGHLPAAILVDGYAADRYGGTGRTAPWNLLTDFKTPVPLILAGGLTPDNVAEAVRVVRPYAVDVASGVESAPGRKDSEKMRRFIAAAREAAANL